MLSKHSPTPRLSDQGQSSIEDYLFWQLTTTSYYAKLQLGRQGSKRVCKALLNLSTEAAEAKLVQSKACGKFDYLTTKPDDLTKLKSTLGKEGVEIESITGDMGTNAVVVYAHEGHMFFEMAFG